MRLYKFLRLSPVRRLLGFAPHRYDIVHLPNMSIVKWQVQRIFANGSDETVIVLNDGTTCYTPLPFCRVRRALYGRWWP